MTTTAVTFLERVYEELEYNNGRGYYGVATSDEPGTSSNEASLSQISWINQARQLGAETIFFVDEFPAVLFFKLDTDISSDTTVIEEEIRRLFLRVWNTSRVPLFFVALPGELRVYSAYQKPVKQEEWLSENRWLRRVQTVAQVAELIEFSRPWVESGRLFQQWQRSFDRSNRVDQWLLKNLKLLRQKLEGQNKEKREFAHALIGRSIFIRYLEDRKVLLADYFTDIDGPRDYQSYTDVLVNKKDTYQLFHKLREDFNGDLFPIIEGEETTIADADLHLLREFLLGRSMDDQPDLLFWAYQFDIIPIELVSNIYEEFYHETGADEDRGTHYTPTSLVDFILSQSLTVERLNAGATLLDPACGSGIFLVEAFKRLVHHACQQQGVTQLLTTDLTELLTNRLVGFDTNKSALQVAAFSLYLAYLDFREPPDIRANKQLPKLIYDPENPENSGETLFHTNAFYLTKDEKAELEERTAGQNRYAGRADDIRASQLPNIPIETPCFDVIVGNPPWGSGSSPDSDVAMQWCEAFRYPLGYKELSQCFMWRVQYLLQPDGEIGLLVSTGVFFKHQANSKAFRQQLLLKNKLRAVYNFAHVRRVFFQSAIAPFAAIFFTPNQNEAEVYANPVSYITMKRETFVDQMQAVIIDREDLRKVRQDDFLRDDWLWKTYMWGRLHDVELIAELKNLYYPLSECVDEYGRGYQEGGGEKRKHTDEFAVSFELPVEFFNQNISFTEVYKEITPRLVHALGQTVVFQGSRLLIKRGISERNNSLGRIQARLAHEPFAFRNSIIGFRIDSLSVEQQKVLLGIILSSLARYYHFLTCSTWGFWHHEIHVEEHLNFPVAFPEEENLQNRIINAVEQITSQRSLPDLFDPYAPSRQAMQDELDEAIFDLYELSEAQRDWVRDMCQVTLEFFYEGTNAQAVKPPSLAWLEDYQMAFLDVWQDRLASREKELETRVFAPHNGLLVGMSFELVDLGTAVTHQPITDNASWQKCFRRLSRSLFQKQAAQIYINSTVKELTDSSMFIIKKSERRLWTKSMARQDVQELLTEVFRLEWQKNKEPV